MKHRTKVVALCAALTALVVPVSAADQPSLRSSQQTSSSSQMKGSSQTCSVNKILEANAKSKDGQELGKVQDVLVNPQTGKIEFVVLNKGQGQTQVQGQVQGTSGDRVPVPWRAVNIQSDGNLVINQDKAKMGSAPSAKNDYSDLQQPDYVVTLYEFYAIPVGGSESPQSQTERGGATSEQPTSGTRTNR